MKSPKLLAPCLLTAALALTGGVMSSIQPAAAATPTARHHHDGPYVPPRSAYKYTGNLIWSWEHLDYRTASYFATPSVTRKLFSLSGPGPRNFVAQGCQGDMGHVYCAFADYRHHLSITLGGRIEAFNHREAHAVDEVIVYHLRK